jgi:hypothetical protein
MKTDSPNVEGTSPSKTAEDKFEQDANAIASSLVKL